MQPQPYILTLVERYVKSVKNYNTYLEGSKETLYSIVEANKNSKVENEERERASGKLYSLIFKEAIDPRNFLQWILNDLQSKHKVTTILLLLISLKIQTMDDELKHLQVSINAFKERFRNSIQKVLTSGIISNNLAKSSSLKKTLVQRNPSKSSDVLSQSNVKLQFPLVISEPPVIPIDTSPPDIQEKISAWWENNCNSDIIHPPDNLHQLDDFKKQAKYNIFKREVLDYENGNPTLTHVEFENHVSKLADANVAQLKRESAKDVCPKWK